MRILNKNESIVKIGGKMSEQGADRAGLIQAIALLVVAVAILLAVVGYFFY